MLSYFHVYQSDSLSIQSRRLRSPCVEIYLYDTLYLCQKRNISKSKAESITTTQHPGFLPAVERRIKYTYKTNAVFGFMNKSHSGYDITHNLPINQIILFCVDMVVKIKSCEAAVCLGNPLQIP